MSTATATATAPASLKRQLGLYTLDIGAPIVLYYILRGAGASNIVALSAGAVVPACSAAVGAITTRRVDAVAILVLAGFVVSIAAALVTHNARFLLAKDGLITAVWGLWFLASLRAHRPAAYEFARPLMEGRRSFAVHSWDAVWIAQPEFRRIWRVSTAIWGIAMLVDALIRVVMSYSLPVHTVPALGGIQWPATFLVIQIVTNVYYHRSGLYELLGAGSGTHSCRPRNNRTFGSRTLGERVPNAASSGSAGRTPDQRP